VPHHSTLTSLRLLTATSAVLFATLASAKPVVIAPGSLDVPDSLQVFDKDERPLEAGGVEGMVVFGPADAPLGAVFIVMYAPVRADAPPGDNFNAAVGIGNPADSSLTARDAKAVDIGGVQGARYVGTLANGMAVRSYVAVNNGYRLTVLLKGPSRAPYRGLMDAFAASVEKFHWAAPGAVASASSASTAARAPVAAAAPSHVDRDKMLALLAGDAPLSPEQLKAYLELALAQPATVPGLYKAGEAPEDWPTALGRLVFPDKQNLKSLQVWTAVKGGDHLKAVLQDNGVGLSLFMSQPLSSGAPTKASAPVITNEVVGWYAARLRERAQP